MNCTFCGMEFDGEICPVCGTKAENYNKGVHNQVNQEDMSYESKKEYTQDNSAYTKICGKCGKHVHADAVVCVHCGCSLGSQSTSSPSFNFKEMGELTKILMIVGIVLMALETCGISLIWCLPMYKHYTETTKRGGKFSMTFKVCTLLFVSMFAGILMLLDNE